MLRGQFSGFLSSHMASPAPALPFPYFLLRLPHYIYFLSWCIFIRTFYGMAVVAKPKHLLDYVFEENEMEIGVTMTKSVTMRERLDWYGATQNGHECQITSMKTTILFVRSVCYRSKEFILMVKNIILEFAGFATGHDYDIKIYRQVTCVVWLLVIP